jgi:hypothetical protein
LIYQVGLNEKEILHVLQQEGFDIKARTLKHVRLTQGLLYQTQDPVAAQLEVEKALSQLRSELSTGQIEGYGRRLLHRHFRSKGILISRCVIQRYM